MKNNGVLHGRGAVLDGADDATRNTIARDTLFGVFHFFELEQHTTEGLGVHKDHRVLVCTNRRRIAQQAYAFGLHLSHCVVDVRNLDKHKHTYKTHCRFVAIIFVGL